MDVKSKKKKKVNSCQIKISAIDLFCGVGGLTRGLEKANIEVKLGIDMDPACQFPYDSNNKAQFLLKPIEDIKGRRLKSIFKPGAIRLLAGCAPCQPFSKYSQGKVTSKDKRWTLLKEFSRLVEEVKPELVTMENVPGLAKQKIFSTFLRDLARLEYNVSYKVINCADYGVPQQRERLVLLASRLGKIELMSSSYKPEKYRTVRQVIYDLPSLSAGCSDKKDALHRTSSLSPINMKRIRVSRPGGTWRDWDLKLVAKCHKKKSGKTYSSVYGRMSWDEPAPTITTQFYGFGNGRFGHPEQNRAISLREGAILQSFPKSYKFVRKEDAVRCKTIGRLIGNAVPVKLGEIIGKSIIKHVSEYAKKKNGRNLRKPKR